MARLAKYAIRALMRFEDEAERDEIFKEMAEHLAPTYPGDDGYVEKHLCHHDEAPVKACEVGERVNASEVPP